MLPVILDIKNLPVFVIGGGKQAQRRLRMLDESGAEAVRVFCPQPEAAMRELAGSRLAPRWPEAEEIAACPVIFVADVADDMARQIVDIARQHATLVNVEDVKPQCDFHVPAIVRRGQLLLSASTGGRSPALARRLKDFLADRFPAIWSGRLDELNEQRDIWRGQGFRPDEVMARSNAYIDEKGWLACQCPLAADSPTHS